MKKLLQNYVLLLCMVVFLFSCATQKKSGRQTIKSLRFLGEFDLPHRMPFNGTTIGGLSGIEYNTAEDVYYLICDDRSDINPARFYSAKIIIQQNGFDTVQLLRVDTLRQKNGLPFPGKRQDPFQVPDPEALRYNPFNGTMIWSSEGERIVQKERTILLNPSINIMTKDGRLVDTFSLPANMHMSKAEIGPRQNGVFEGLAFTPDYKTLFVSMEEPLYEDGPRAGLKDTTGLIRILQYDVATKQPGAQFAYRIDPVVQEPISEGLFVVNGVTDILAINDHQLLVTERSFSTGRLTCNVRVYLSDLKGAANIAGVTSIKELPTAAIVQKKLLLNMDTLGRWIDNVEGATFGPRLPNGKRSILFVTDDNFSAMERTQFFLFEVND